MRSRAHKNLPHPPKWLACEPGQVKKYLLRSQGLIFKKRFRNALDSILRMLLEVEIEPLISLVTFIVTFRRRLVSTMKIEKSN